MFKMVTLIEYISSGEALTGQPEDFTLIGSVLGVSRLLLHSERKGLEPDSVSETLPDNMGLSWFPVFSNGSQLWGFFLSGAPSECCPTGRRSSENKMTERTEEGWKKRRRGGKL